MSKHMFSWKFDIHENLYLSWKIQFSWTTCFSWKITCFMEHTFLIMLQVILQTMMQKIIHIILQDICYEPVFCASFLFPHEHYYFSILTLLTWNLLFSWLIFVFMKKYEVAVQIITNKNVHRHINIHKHITVIYCHILIWLWTLCIYI